MYKIRWELEGIHQHSYNNMFSCSTSGNLHYMQGILLDQGSSRPGTSSNRWHLNSSNHSSVDTEDRQYQKGTPRHYTNYKWLVNLGRSSREDYKEDNRFHRNIIRQYTRYSWLGLSHTLNMEIHNPSRCFQRGIVHHSTRCSLLK